MRALVVLGMLTGCAEILGIEDLPVDAATDGPVSTVCTEVGNTCTGRLLHECAAVGELDVITECELGCVEGVAGAHCGRQHDEHARPRQVHRHHEQPTVQATR